MTSGVASPPGHGRRGWILRLWDRSVHRVVYTILMATVAVALATLVVPPLRVYTGAHEQVIGSVVVMLLAVELAGARLHRLVDWLLYGQRHDPAAASARLALPLQESDDEHALEALLVALTETLRLTFVSVCVSGDEDAIALGQEPSSAVSFPIRRAGHDHGELRAARRDQPLDQRDERLLEAAAAQIGMVLHARALAEDIQLARDQLVLSMEEERRRLRREIHDGIGPTLAGIALGVESAGRALDRDPRRAQLLLTGVHEDVSELVAEVRRVVEGLRPALLDELGLAGALRDLSRGFQTRTGCRIQVEAQVPGSLPAAVEAAAYRIGAEAMTNVARHAAAGVARIEITTTDEHLVLRVSDDGRGGAVERPGGTGLGSMRQRAEELGGTLQVVCASAGTTLTARLPLTEGLS